MIARRHFIWGGLVILLFLGALFWAKARDPFSRQWLTLKTAEHGSFKCVAVLPKLSRASIALRWLAVLLATWALAETALHLITPHFSVNDTTLSIARRFLIQPKQRADFEWLAAQPIWPGGKLRTLLDQVELAGYNRELINWQLDDKVYQEFVLSPVIGDSTINSPLSTGPDWRRPLWEEFYPRIRHESSAEDAARIVVRHLRERVTILKEAVVPQSISEIWRQQMTDAEGFERIYVATLRSVGIPAKTSASQKTEIFSEGRWLAAPRPLSW